MSLMGIDVGLSRCRVAAFSLRGAPLAWTRRDYRLEQDPEGHYRLDPLEVWRAVCDAISEIGGEQRPPAVRADPVQAIAVCSVGQPLVPLSVDGRILGPGLLGAGGAESDCAAAVEQALGVQRLFDITGAIPLEQTTLPLLCWLQEHRKQLYINTWRFLPLGSLITFMLGGSAVCDPSLAARTGLLDVAHRDWSREALQAAGLSARKRSPLSAAGSAVGVMRPSLAQKLGLAPGVRLVLGAHDVACRALGSGVAEGGLAGLYLGNEMELLPAFHAIPLTSLLLTRGLGVGPHAAPGLFLSRFYEPSGGRVLRWFVETLAPMERQQARRRGSNVYDELLSEMPERPTRLMALPRLTSSRAAPGAGGALLGLRLQTGRGELVKALLEGVMYGAARGQDLYEEAGVRISRYHAAGGGARSEAWLQLAADVLGLPVARTRVPEAAVLGAALLAGVGCGAYADVQEAVQASVHLDRVLEPDAERHRFYQERLAQHRRLGEMLDGEGLLADGE